MLAIICLTPLLLIGVSIAIIAHMAPVLDSLLDRYSENPADAKTALHYYYTYIASATEDLPKIPGMQDNELEHLRDVRSVWRRGVIGLAGVIFLLGLLIWRAKKDGSLRPGLEYGSMATVILMITSQFVPFDDLWTWFHSLTFPQGNWVFEYNAKIVQLYTAEFFEAAVLRIALLALFFAMCTYGIAMLLKRGEHKRQAAKELEKEQALTTEALTVDKPRQEASLPKPRHPEEPPEALFELQEMAKKHKEEK
jgi:integral membrane protein (TIGR01906 family)